MNEFVNQPVYLWPLLNSNNKSFLWKIFLLENETFEIIGTCMEVQGTLGHGFSEVIYKRRDGIGIYLKYFFVPE